MTSQNVGDFPVGVQMVDDEERCLQRQQLVTWSKKIPLIVGFETVAEALLGRETSLNFLLSKYKHFDRLCTEDFEGEIAADTFIDSMIDQDNSISLDDDIVYSDFPLDLRKPEKKVNSQINGMKRGDNEQTVEITPLLSIHSSLNPWLPLQPQPTAKEHSNISTYHHHNGNHSNDNCGNEGLNSKKHSKTENDNIPSEHGRTEIAKGNGNFQFPNITSNSRDMLSNGSLISKFPGKRSIHGDDRKFQSWKRKAKSESGEDDEDGSLKFPIDWKISNNRIEALDFEKTETFKGLGISSSEGSTSTEESIEPTIDQPSISLFQMNNKVEHLLMSVIAKNILEKYNQVRNDKGCAVPLSDFSADQKLATMESDHPGLLSAPSSNCLQSSRSNNLTINDISFKNSFPSAPTSSHLKSFDSFPSVTSSTSNPSIVMKKSRPKRGQYRRYNRQLLLEAVRAVQQGDMSVHRAGSYFGVPHSTLEYKVKERHLLRNKKSSQEQKHRTNISKNISNAPPSHSNQLFTSILPSKESTRSLPNLRSPNNKHSEFIKNNHSSPDNEQNFRFPHFNDVLRNTSLPVFYSNVFEGGLPLPYNWLVPGLPHTPLFPLPFSPCSMLNAFAPLPNGPDFNLASDLLRQLNSKLQNDRTSSMFNPSSIKSLESNDDSSQPHSTSSAEIDLRITPMTL